MKAGTAALNNYNNCGLCFKQSDISVSDFFDYYYKNYCLAQLKETTCEKYEKNIRLHLKPALGHYKLGTLSTPVIQEFINKKYEDGYSRNTLCNLKALLTGSFEFGIDSNFIRINPATRVKIPSSRVTDNNPNTRKNERVPITKEQFDMIISRFPENSTSYIPLMLGYHCGLRISETFALTWSDIDFENKTLDINKQIQWLHHKWFFSEPKYNSFRTIKLDSEIIKILKKHKIHQLENKLRYSEYYTEIYINDLNELDTQGKMIDMICRKENGEYLQSRSQQHTNHIIHTELGLEKYNYHTLRHTHATMLLEAGAPIKDVQYRLGHKNIKETLDIYTHCTHSMSEKTVAILNQIM